VARASAGTSPCAAVGGVVRATTRARTKAARCTAPGGRGPDLTLGPDLAARRSRASLDAGGPGAGSLGQHRGLHVEAAGLREHDEAAVAADLDGGAGPEAGALQHGGRQVQAAAMVDDEVVHGRTNPVPEKPCREAAIGPRDGIQGAAGPPGGLSAIGTRRGASPPRPWASPAPPSIDGVHDGGGAMASPASHGPCATRSEAVIKPRALAEACPGRRVRARRRGAEGCTWR